MWLVANGTEDVQGISCNRYTVPDTVFASQNTSSDNYPYYADGPDGLLNVSNCGFNAQVRVYVWVVCFMLSQRSSGSVVGALECAVCGCFCWC